MLRAGAAEVCITPPIGVELAGYGPGRDRFSTGIHDHLMAQALVLDDGQTQVALIVADLLSISPEFAQSVRQEVAERTGIPPEHVMVACTHSHTTPTTGPTRECGMPDHLYVKITGRHLAGAVVSAALNLQPARLFAAAGEHNGLAWNRVGGTAIDRALTTLRVEAEDGRLIAMLINFACHPVMLGPLFQVSADYPGALREYVKYRHPGSVVLFMNGTCGNIDPITNREVWGQATFEDVEQAGQKLGKDALRIAAKGVEIEATPLVVNRAVARLDFKFPTAKVLSAAILKLRDEARRSTTESEAVSGVSGFPPMPRFWLGYYRSLQKRIRGRVQPDHIKVELQAITLGESLVLVAIPGEVYAEQGLMMRELSGYQFTMPVCYANGLYGYLPPREAFEDNSYAASLAAAVFDQPPYQPDVAERLIKAVTPLLSR